MVCWTLKQVLSSVRKFGHLAAQHLWWTFCWLELCKFHIGFLTGIKLLVGRLLVYCQLLWMSSRTYSRIYSSQGPETLSPMWVQGPGTWSVTALARSWIRSGTVETWTSNCVGCTWQHNLLHHHTDFVTHFYSALNNILRSGCTTVYPLHLWKDILVAFGSFE